MSTKRLKNVALQLLRLILLIQKRIQAELQFKQEELLYYKCWLLLCQKDTEEVMMQGWKV